MRIVHAVLSASFLAATAAAQPFDPLKSEACGQALQRLEASRQQEPSAAARLRAEAAQACLGGSDAPARPARLARPPVAVPPPPIEPPAGPALSIPAPQLAPPPVEIQRPPVITACDAHGCWTAEGARLPRAGPGLSGACSAHGGLAYCP